MKRASARKGIRVVAWNADMAHFGMPQAMEQGAIHHCSAADASAYGQVQEIGNTLRRAPSGLTERRAIDVRIERHRQIQTPAYDAGQIEIAPSGFWGGRNPPRRQIYRTE